MMKKLFISLCMAVLLTAMVVIPSVHAEEMDIQSLPFHSIEGFIVNEPETFASLVERSPYRDLRTPPSPSRSPSKGT